MKKVVVCIIGAAVIFATMEVVLKIVGADIGSMQLTFMRFLIGGIVLLPPAALERRRTGYVLNFRDLRWIAAIGAVCIPVSMVAYQIAIMHLNASSAAPIFCTNPLFTMLIAHTFTDDKMDRKKWIALFMGLVAVLFMVRPWDVQSGNSLIGVAIMLFASFTFAVYSVMGKRSIGRIGAFTQTSISFIIGSSLLLVIMLITGQPLTEGLRGNIPVVLYCSVVVTGIGYLIYFLAIRYSNATTAAITFFIKPAIAPVFAVILLSETILWNTVVGIILLITASFISISDALRKTAAGEG